MIPAMIPLDPTEPAVSSLRQLGPDPCCSRWRGHEIRITEDPPRVWIDGCTIAVYSVGPERYRTWLLWRAEFRSPLSLARALVEVYFALSDRTTPPPEVTEELELLPPD